MARTLKPSQECIIHFKIVTGTCTGVEGMRELNGPVRDLGGCALGFRAAFSSALHLEAPQQLLWRRQAQAGGAAPLPRRAGEGTTGSDPAGRFISA